MTAPYKATLSTSKDMMLRRNPLGRSAAIYVRVPHALRNKLVAYANREEITITEAVCRVLSFGLDHPL